MRFLLLLLLLPFSYSLTINATGYTSNGVSYVVKQEVSAMNEIIEQCILSSFGNDNYIINYNNNKEAKEITHSIARCMFYKHHMRSSIRNQYTIRELIKKMRDLYIQDTELNLNMENVIYNTTDSYLNILNDITDEILSFEGQIRGFYPDNKQTEGQAQDLIDYLTNEKNKMETTEINIALDFDKLEEIYTYFVEKFINIQTELKTIELYTNNNNTALTDAITLFKADIIDHYLEVAEMLDTQGLITNAFDAYECITDNRTECIFPNAVSEHLETCSRASVIFGENGQFLSFNSLIQVAEESMCSDNTTCIDTQYTDWSELVYTWTYGLQSVSSDRWICVNFNDIASNVQGPRNRLRADKHTYGKQIAKWIQQQKDSNGAFNIASSGLSDAFNAFSVTTLPTYDATKDIMADVFVDDSSNMQCTIDCRLYVLDICCIDPNALKTMFHKNNDEYKVKYSTRVKTYNPALYDRDEITITTEIAEPAVRYGYLAASESISLVDILKLLNVTGCEKVAECKKKASDAIDCTYNVNTRNENSDCDIGSLFLPDDRDTETVYTSSDLGTSSPIPLTAYTPDTTTCTVEQDTTKNTFDECKTHLTDELYHKNGSYTRNDFIFGHYTGTSCKLYKCTKTTFLENKGGDEGQLIPLKPVQNKTVIIEVLQAGNSNVNPLALACPVNYEATCTACQGGWSIGNAARDAWTDIDASRQNPANPQNWGHCSESSQRTRISTDTQNYCDAEQTKPCQLVHVTSATFVKTTGQLTITWDTSIETDYPSGQYLTIKHGSSYSNIIDGADTAVLNIQDNDYNPIHLYRSDTSGKDLGDYLAHICHKHKGKYNEYPVQVEENPQCVQYTSRERQLFNVTSQCVVDDTSSFGACQDNNKQYKELLQIKLPYDGSDPYTGCTGASQSCYKCAFGQQNKNNDIKQTCEDCTEGTYSDTYDELNKLTCQPCASGTYQNQTGQTSCTSITTCLDGHYITQNSSSTQNRLCAPCAAGTYAGSQNSYFCQTCGIHQYQPTAGQSSCLTASTCPAGKGVTTAHTTINNTICNNCTLNQTFSDSNSYDACESVNHCDPITEAEATAATLTTDVVCGCNSGFIVNVTADECQQCPSGSFQTDVAHAKTTCDTWKTCAAGSYISTNGTHKIDRECSPCGIGTYSSSSNVYQCTDCAEGTYQNVTGQTSCVEDGKCGLGQGMKTEATDDSDTVCENCVAGKTFSNTDSSTEPCQSVTVTSCVAGKRFVAATTTADGQCVDCTEGTYISSETEHTQKTCDAWATCAAGSYITQNASSTHNRLCAPCAAGSISTTANAIQCTVCASGTYQDGTGQTSCKTGSTCPIGKGLQTAAQGSTDTSCVNCNGTTTFSDVDSYDACKTMDSCSDAGEAIQTAGNATTDNGCACAAGFYNPEGTACAACSSGTYTTVVNNQAYCTYHTNCTDGSIVSFAGNSTHDRECEACGSGTYSSGTNTEGSGGAYTLQLTDASGTVLTSTNIHNVLEDGYDSFLLPEDNINYGCTLGTDNVSSTTCTVTFVTNPAYYNSNALAYYASKNGVYVSNVKEIKNSNGTPMYIGFTGIIKNTFYVKFKDGENIAKIESSAITMLNSNADSYSSSASGYGGHLWALFQVNPPSGCAAWSTCTSYEYESSTGSTTADRVCSPLTTCDAGEYVQNASTATSDRLCAPCAAGSFSSTENAMQCTTWDVCDAGEYITQNASSTQNRLCAPCAAGSFSTGQNAISCTVWDTCDAGTDSSRGEYVTQNASSTQDRLCASCATETYAATVNAYQCVALLPANDACTVNYQCTSANCNNNVCAGQSCTSHTSCAASEYCDSATSACAAKLGTGTSCIDNEYCQSNNCYDDGNGAVCAASGGGGGGGGNCGENIGQDECDEDSNCVWNQDGGTCDDSSSGGGSCGAYGEACGAECCEGLTCTDDICGD